MKKWETREWWESRKWSKEDIEEMWQEEQARLSNQPWFESGKPCRTTVFWERDWQEEFELTWGKWGAQGIGKGIAERFAGEGAKVAILDIQREKTDKVAKAIEAKGSSALAITMDITDSDDVKRDALGDQAVDGLAHPSGFAGEEVTGGQYRFDE